MKKTEIKFHLLNKNKYIDIKEYMNKSSITLRKAKKSNNNNSFMEIKSLRINKNDILERPLLIPKIIQKNKNSRESVKSDLLEIFENRDVYREIVLKDFSSSKNVLNNTGFNNYHKGVNRLKPKFDSQDFLIKISFNKDRENFEKNVNMNKSANCFINNKAILKPNEVIELKKKNEKKEDLDDLIDDFNNRRSSRSKELEEEIIKNAIQTNSNLETRVDNVFHLNLPLITKRTKHKSTNEIKNIHLERMMRINERFKKLKVSTDFNTSKTIFQNRFINMANQANSNLNSNSLTKNLKNINFENQIVDLIEQSFDNKNSINNNSKFSNIVLSQSIQKPKQKCEVKLKIRKFNTGLLPLKI